MTTHAQSTNVANVIGSKKTDKLQIFKNPPGQEPQKEDVSGVIWMYGYPNYTIRTLEVLNKISLYMCIESVGMWVTENLWAGKTSWRL